MARRHARRHTPHRRNPSLLGAHQSKLVPLALAGAGLYLLMKSHSQATGQAIPVNGLGTLGFGFKSITHAVQQAASTVAKSVAAPLQVAVRIAAAPIKIATGSSISDVAKSIQAPAKGLVAAVKNMSPQKIMGKGGTSTTVTPTATGGQVQTYADVNGGSITAAQYAALNQAIGQGSPVGPISDASGTWWALPTGVCTTTAPSTPTTAPSSIAYPNVATGQSFVDPSTGATSVGPTNATGVVYYDPNGNTISQTQYTAEMAAMGMAVPSAPMTDSTPPYFQVPQPMSAAQAQAVSSAAINYGAPAISPTYPPGSTAPGAPAMNAGGSGSGQSFVDDTYDTNPTGPDPALQDQGGPGGSAAAPAVDPNAPAGVAVATATKPNWMLVGGAVVAVPVLMHFMNK